MPHNGVQAGLPNPARGAKHTCGSDECGRRFYDLNRTTLDCPYCGAPFVETAVLHHEFQMAPGKQLKSKNYKLAAPPVQAEETEAEEEADAEVEADGTEDDADAGTPNVLIEDDDTDTTTDDIVEKDRTSDGAP